MNFRNLQYFLAAAEEKNFTHAARRLYISQQSLSGHVAKLEEELGVPLFERGPELKLTYAGERFQPKDTDNDLSYSVLTSTAESINYSYSAEEELPNRVELRMK